MFNHKARWFSVSLAVALILPTLSTASPLAQAQSSQPSSRTFPETGKTIRGKFLTYWNEHGGLAQQGYPISDEMQERSDTDGRTYTVQYFERAVFEYHPENQPPFDVLLSLLGVFFYNQKYLSGAPVQTPSNGSSYVLFQATGKHVGGVFLDYWQKNGGLAQQGYPISEEFDEVSTLNGKTYKVQYFQRAVFELHPENQPPYNVLLSQLGTFRYRNKYLQPSPTLVPPTSTGVPTNTPMPTNTPVPLTSCEGIPSNVEMYINPPCAPLYSKFHIKGFNFPNDSEVGVYSTMPNGQVFGAPFHVPYYVARGETQEVVLYIDDETPYFGLWTVTMEGTSTHKKSFGYFKLVPGTPTP